MRKVLICDDQQRFLDEFSRRHKGHYEITTLFGSENLLDYLKSSDEFPDIVLLDLYFPIDETADDFDMKVAAAEAELAKLDQQIRTTKAAVSAVWAPDGIALLKEIREKWGPSKLPVVIYTQKGLLLLNDEQLRAVETLNGHWLLKGQLSRETEKLRINRIMSYDAPTSGKKIFIGHGRKPLWTKLRNLLEDEFGLACLEFNTQPTAGVPTFDRLWEMLQESRFAFLIMTGEDADRAGGLRARENVVHEIGLFQGHLGPRNAVVLVEEGCREFSNIKGFGQIPFPRDDIEASFEEVRRILASRKLVAV